MSSAKTGSILSRGDELIHREDIVGQLGEVMALAVTNVMLLIHKYSQMIYIFLSFMF